MSILRSLMLVSHNSVKVECPFLICLLKQIPHALSMFLVFKLKSSVQLNVWTLKTTRSPYSRFLLNWLMVDLTLLSSALETSIPWYVSVHSCYALIPTKCFCPNLYQAKAGVVSPMKCLKFSKWPQATIQTHTPQWRNRSLCSWDGATKKKYTF